MVLPPQDSVPVRDADPLLRVCRHSRRVDRRRSSTLSLARGEARLGTQEAPNRNTSDSHNRGTIPNANRNEDGAGDAVTRTA